MLLSEIIIFALLAIIFLIPGWAFLGASGIWRRWSPLARWIIATGIGIAFYPVLFYTARFFLPSLRLGWNKLFLILIFLLIVALFSIRKNWIAQVRFNRLEVVAIFIFFATLFVRLWMAHKNPFPAWSDSLHHTLITQLVAENGSLPFTLLPYSPTPLSMYHLGLYSISGMVKILTSVPSHTALLLTAQFLNGLCGLGVYLALERKAGRVGAVIGALVVGLLSFQPAWYVNWGRFTQVSSQAVLLIAWIVSWEAIESWRCRQRNSWKHILGLSTAAGLLNSAVFLLHFQVAGFYLPLLAISVFYELIQGLRQKSIKYFLYGCVVVAAITVLFILPVLTDALTIYFQHKAQLVTLEAQGRGQARAYYEFAFPDSLFAIGVQKWLVWIALIAVLVGLSLLQPLIIMIFMWLIFLYIEGHLYLFNIQILNFTNFGAILIMFYLPISLLIGNLIQTLSSRLHLSQNRFFSLVFVPIVLLLGWLGMQERIRGLDPIRYFVTNQDITAMQWIKDNTPPDAVFGINTYHWLGNFPHGTDAGYWIPYLADRQTTTGTMLLAISDSDYIDMVTARSDAVRNFAENPIKTVDLCSLGVDYLYIGKLGNPIQADMNLNAELIRNGSGAQLVYENEGVTIFDLCQ